MRGKWNRNDQGQHQSTVPQKYAVDDPIVAAFKPKLHHTPSLRAIRTYNELPVDGDFQDGIDTTIFHTIPRRKCDNSSVISKDSLASDSHVYEYATVGTFSITNSAPSELNSEMGSTVRLVHTKMGLSCQTWWQHVSTALCTACMAAGMGNVYRLPQSALIRGGLPFVVAHTVLTLMVGLPLLFLELGVGQMAQDGVVKAWRAVPFFKGIGYIKLLAGCLLSIYYPLYMGLSTFYIIWLLKGPAPFQECSARVKMTENGYSSVGKKGQDCIKETFIKPPLEDPYWFGIFTGFLLVIWIIITVLSIRKTKSYIRSLIILFFPMIFVNINLFVKSVILEQDTNSLGSFFTKADWSRFISSEVWYYACIQVFFSTNVGFGQFVTNAGIIYNKVNPCWTAIGYITTNLLFGLGSVLISQSLTGSITNSNVTNTHGDIAELYLTSLIYDITSSSKDSEIKAWAIMFFLLILLSGFISMATITYALLKTLTIESRRRLKWWHTSIILSFVGYVSGSCILFQPNFDIVHLLDHYIVGNLILICTVIEVLALITFYGIDRIRSDFEFMLGHILSRLWLLLWWVLPILLTFIFAWGMITLPMERVFKDDQAWMYGIGWGVVLSATVFIFAVGGWIMMRQEGYTIKDKFSESVKPSQNWGPTDPMSRHNWVQWNTKAKQGERDFTLKRKGTKDYTRSIKKSKKMAALSELSNTVVDGVYKENSKQSIRTDGSNVYNEVLDHLNGSLRVTSIIDSFDLSHYNTAEENRVKNINPLSRTNSYINGSTIEEYGTFRKGPYIINDNANHVCYRRYSDSEDATQL
nr:unnamed protein product [Callosobruchus analis]